MQLTYRLDYLTITTDEEVAAQIGPPYENGRWLLQKGMWGYDQCWQDTGTGVKKLRSSTRPDMGVCFTATSKALDKIQKLSGEPSQLWALDKYGFSRGRATRIDLAIDIWDNGALTSRVRDAARDGLIITDARKISIIEGIKNDAGLTVYVGSRASPRFVRVYNKYVESNGEVPTTRIELEAKDYFALELWKALSASRSPDVVKQAVLGAIHSFIPGFGVPEIDTIFIDAKEVGPSPRADPEADTKKWLSHQVIPTLLRSIRDTPDADNLFMWLNTEIERRLLSEE